MYTQARIRPSNSIKVDIQICLLCLKTFSRQSSSVPNSPRVSLNHAVPPEYRGPACHARVNNSPQARKLQSHPWSPPDAARPAVIQRRQPTDRTFSWAGQPRNPESIGILAIASKAAPVLLYLYILIIHKRVPGPHRFPVNSSSAVERESRIRMIRYRATRSALSPRPRSSRLQGGARAVFYWLTRYIGPRNVALRTPADFEACYARAPWVEHGVYWGAGFCRNGGGACCWCVGGLDTPFVLNGISDFQFFLQSFFGIF